MADNLLYECVVMTEGSSFLIRYDEQRMNEVLSYHIHPEWEICYIYKGHGNRVVGGVLEPTDEGDILIVPSNMPHCVVYDFPADDPEYKVKEYTIQFKSDIFTDKLAVLPEFQPLADYLRQQQSALQPLGATAEKIRTLMRTMYHEDSLSRLQHLVEILITIKDSHEIKFIHTNNTGTIQEKQLSLVQQMLFFMVNQMQHDLTLDEMTDKFNMSKTTFCTFFKKATGKTFCYCLNEIRINRAAVLLLNQPEKSIKEISFEVGFSSISHFNHVFLDMKGTSPSKYRSGGNNPRN